eukprot:17520-Amphidinium_carterae.1
MNNKVTLVTFFLEQISHAALDVIPGERMVPLCEARNASFYFMFCCLSGSLKMDPCLGRGVLIDS